jgi:hypothetical protein
MKRMRGKQHDKKRDQQNGKNCFAVYLPAHVLEMVKQRPPVEQNVQEREHEKQKRGHIVNSHPEMPLHRNGSALELMVDDSGDGQSEPCSNHRYSDKSAFIELLVDPIFHFVTSVTDKAWLGHASAQSRQPVQCSGSMKRACLCRRISTFPIIPMLQMEMHSQQASHFAVSSVMNGVH